MALSQKGLQAGPSLENLSHRIETLIEQVDHLYRLYLDGVEKIPPLQQRALLDQLIGQLQVAQKSGQIASFRSNGIQAKYQTYRQRWEKWLKDLEMGRTRLRGR